MDSFRIIPLKVGAYVGLEHSSFTLGQNLGKKLPCPIIAFLLKSINSTILVDTGPGTPELMAERRHPAITQTEDEQLLNALSRHGVTPDDIDFVINTHLHYDHCYGNIHFTKQPIYLQRKEWIYAMDPLPTHWLTYESQYAGMFPPFLRNIDKQNIVLIDGKKELAPGITLVPLPGHSPGMQGVLVATSKGNRFIVSDAIPIYENWNNYSPRLPSGIMTSLTDYYDTLKVIESYDCPILPGHDPKVFELYPPQQR
jgi:Zn-dependent hydrolases, including glyoxylases